MSKTYSIGTRASLLAMTQSTLIKEELEARTGDRFELVSISTQGDQNTSVPLWQLEGKDFFTKELDQALLNKEVDCVIHSYKDLGSERPAGIELAAITERKFAHDIMLISQQTIDEMDQLTEFIVGTSSPRRIYNMTHFLSDYLPRENLKVRTKILRGNVNTRIEKLKRGDYHAIVLAFAGLERLASRDDSREVLKELIKGLNFMVMPTHIFPSAASQGALGIECAQDCEEELKQKLAQLNHADTIAEISRERTSFQKYGGGCHLAVGIHVKKCGDDFYHTHRGECDGREIYQSQLERNITLTKQKFKNIFMGLPSQKLTSPHIVTDELYTKKPCKVSPQKVQNLFCTSSYCIHALEQVNHQFLWAAGLKTHQRLARQGKWVNGQAGVDGEQELIKFQQSNFLKLFWGDQTWSVLSHAKSNSRVGPLIPCYEHQLNPVSESMQESILKCEAFYWTSWGQFAAYRSKFPAIESKFHACGMGKTLHMFKEAKIPVTSFPDIQSFYDTFVEVP